MGEEQVRSERNWECTCWKLEGNWMCGLQRERTSPHGSLYSEQLGGAPVN